MLVLDTDSHDSMKQYTHVFPVFSLPFSACACMCVCVCVCVCVPVIIPL